MKFVVRSHFFRTGKPVVRRGRKAMGPVAGRSLLPACQVAEGRNEKQRLIVDVYVRTHARFVVHPRSVTWDRKAVAMMPALTHLGPVFPTNGRDVATRCTPVPSRLGSKSHSIRLRPAPG